MVILRMWYLIKVKEQWKSWFFVDTVNKINREAGKSVQNEQEQDKSIYLI